MRLDPALTVEGADQVASLELLRATMALQQACVIASVVLRGVLPVPASVGLIVLRDTTQELLQRGLLVTFLAGWLADRCFEAGAEDTIMFLGDSLPLTDACRWGMAAVAATVMLPPVIADAQGAALSVATNWAVLSARNGKPGASTDELLQEYRLYDSLQRAVFAVPARLTWSLHVARGMLRFTAINAVFAATQNLAASLALSVVSNLLLLAYTTQARRELGLRRNGDALTQG